MKENAKENELVKKLTNKHYTITTAESCTGGLLSATIINVPGASDVINCAYVTYANEAKENLVSVSHETLEKVLSAKRQQPKCVLAVQRQRKQTWDFLQPALRDRAVVPKKSLLGLCIWAVHCMSRLQ